MVYVPAICYTNSSIGHVFDMDDSFIELTTFLPIVVAGLIQEDTVDLEGVPCVGLGFKVGQGLIDGHVPEDLGGGVENFDAGNDHGGVGIIAVGIDLDTVSEY